MSSTAHRIPFVPGCLAAGVAEATVEVGLHFLINGLLLPPPPLRGRLAATAAFLRRHPTLSPSLLQPRLARLIRERRRPSNGFHVQIM